MIRDSSSPKMVCLWVPSLDTIWSAMFKNKQRKINCLKCRHYFVTWDKKFPRGCQTFDFKTRFMPSDIVYHSSDMQCQFFAPKKNADKS